ncbi:PTS glucitol/sorbitol transporter subunit IIB [Clostridium psychrophilum]|uniref:PTS glucitol/sorbitol transporter subunit IIB n=1 Tax=Clostridium psychrophilum TaxID=132926 RepID=UPI001C0C2D61|nr:PTS glucitol/sorbitol transporter subunit IIB [Clostridium psychrophilum]MBU3179805.1 PTS glucitol/sorbitol transporter subunit IIB [Clostridium psychrophilum]
MYKAVKVVKGSSGWGGPLIIKPTEEKHIILNVCGGVISPISEKIAELTGAEIVDGFKTGVPDDQVMVAVVDCGGTCRCGVYPKKRIPTINLLPSGQTGPLAKFIQEDIYVSGVKEANIKLYDGEVAEGEEETVVVEETPKAKTNSAPVQKVGLLTRLGKGVGGVVGIFYQAGRDTIDTVIKNILPFMAFVSLIMGIITATGIGNVIAKTISPFAATLPGLLLISIICTIPVLSPILGPGAVIAQIVGVVVGTQIGLGHIPPQFALPALFAIDPQVGCDFIPVGLSLGEATPETIEIGVPAVLFSRVITGPISVLIAYAFSAGLFQ